MGYVAPPIVETIKIESPHLLFGIIFLGVIALVGWNIGVSILTPLNGLLLINFVPVTTLVISIVQGNQVTSYTIIGIIFIFIFIFISLVSNNIYSNESEEKEIYKKVSAFP